jgi:hypothetical protein
VLSIRNAVILSVVAAAALSQAAESDWINESRGVLEMRLAHRDTQRVDGGTLCVDRERRTVSWEGAPNEIGCQRPWEVAFEDVVDVRADAPGFLVVLRRGPEKEVRLAPLPHFRALIGEARHRSVGPDVKDALRGPDGDPLPLGGTGASTTPTFTPRVLAPEVQSDGLRAAEAILRALGRPSG